MLRLPGVALKIMRMFRCTIIENTSWLSADMRLQCYSGQWFAFAFYALVFAVVYVVGFPLGVLVLLHRNRYTLHGDAADPAVVATKNKLGFLYEVYGPSAWWWEVEELIRKLLLSALVVLIEPGSPLQITLAVLVSGWAHVLHAMYKPWGQGSAMYALQHGSLFVTSFVFLMGLLFKVNGVTTTSPTYSALSSVMLLACTLFLVTWVAVVLVAMTLKIPAVFTSLHARWPALVTRVSGMLVAAGTQSTGTVATSVHSTAWSSEGVGGVSVTTAGELSISMVNPLRVAGSVPEGATSKVSAAAAAAGAFTNFDRVKVYHREGRIIGRQQPGDAGSMGIHFSWPVGLFQD